MLPSDVRDFAFASLSKDKDVYEWLYFFFLRGGAQSVLSGLSSPSSMRKIHEHAEPFPRMA